MKPSPEPGKIMNITVTAPDKAWLSDLATRLIDQRLAASANITPIESIYRWEGQVHTSNEALLTIRTQPQHFKAIQAIVKDEHPYQTPHILGHHINDSDPDYTQWVIESTNQ